MTTAFINPTLDPWISVDSLFMYVYRKLSKRVLLQTFNFKRIVQDETGFKVCECHARHRGGTFLMYLVYKSTPKSKGFTSIFRSTSLRRVC